MSENDITRRGFIKAGCASLIGFSLGAALPGTWLDNKVFAIAASEGYLLVDTKKCQGCSTCTLICSLAHHGKINPSIGRIQIMQNPFKGWPDDIDIAQCRQCTYPACAAACPTGALHADKKNGNVRLVSKEKCIGCQRCIEACPQKPGRAIWNHVEKHSQKCDLCSDTPFWKEQGGPKGKQACVSVCPVGAIKFTKEIPIQEGDAGYKVNLRQHDAWGEFGWPTE